MYLCEQISENDLLHAQDQFQGYRIDKEKHS